MDTIDHEALAQTLDEALFSYAMKEFAKVTPEHRFAHYTSAETAMRILQGEGDGKRYLWLRNASDMNDFSEVEWGQFCLQTALGEEAIGQRLSAIINRVSPDMTTRLGQALAGERQTMKAGTHLLSLALHDGQQAQSGLLSMWRAYGGQANVCLIMNTAAFTNQQDAWELVLSPVMYGGPEEYKRHLSAMLDQLEERISSLMVLGPEALLYSIKRALDFSVLSTKHPAFQEENEWRVIHQPSPFRPDPPSQIVSVNGIVQKIHKVPMMDQADKGLEGANPNALIDRIIIGPTPNYELVRAAFVRLLKEAGVEEAEDKVQNSGIPLRR